jgi:uncharacterized protein YfaS (alpha-2-macroglobulin family)
MLARTALLLLFSLPAQAAWIQQFTPQELVDRQTRATAVFSTDMVPLGLPQAPAPFRVDCGGVPGNGRWADTKTWAWQLDRPLEPGERCEFQIKPNLKTAKGEEVSGQTYYRFYAPGPWPRRLFPAPGDGVAEDQAFVIEPAGAVDVASFEQNAWCEAEGVGQRIPLRLVPAKQREEILAHLRRPGAETLVAACAERLPPGAKMKLVWGKGIAAANGKARAQRTDSFSYTVNPPFRATLSCERERADTPCSPLSALSLTFSAPVDAALRGKIKLVTPEGTRLPVDPDAHNSARANTATEFVFAKPFPQNAELRLELPAGIRDQADRPLANASSFPLKFKTGLLPPLAKFSGDFGIVELAEGGVLPVTVRNVEAKLRLVERRLTDDADVIATLHRLRRFEQQTRKVKLVRDGQAEEFEDPYYARELSFLANTPGTTVRELPKPGGTQEFEVVGIPLAKPGLHIVEVESRLLGAALLSRDKNEPKPMYVRAAALVTNLAVHLKQGKDNGLVWVTALDSGKPVPGADVNVFDCAGKPLWHGKTDSNGVARADRPLSGPVDGKSCGEAQFVFASARLGEDYSFVRSDWNEGIEAWRFGVPTWGNSDGDPMIRTVFDRSLFRPGQTVSMKHFARNRASAGLAFPEPAKLPKRLTIRHDASGDEYGIDLAWDAKGTATSQWKIPAAAKRGTYVLSLPSQYDAGEFRVSDFRLPVFTGSVQGAAKRYVAPQRVPLALGLNFLNGGAAKGAAVTVSATVRPTWPQWTGYDRFGFQGGLSRDDLAAFGLGEDSVNERLVLDKQALTLDQAGAGKLEVALAEALPGGIPHPAELYAEMSFADPNGEIQTIHGTVPLWPSAVALGMAIADWTQADGKARADIVALDLDGKPVAGQEISVLGKRRVTYSNRRRIVGGFYAYENRDEYIDLGTVCQGRTDAQGLLRCDVAPGGSGEILLLASAKDAQGKPARAGGSFWNYGGGDTWFAAGNQDRIDVIPEKREYRAGETARFQVRTPFREGTALVSVEAGGIVETFVRPLSRFNPIVDVPVKAEWAPNVYVSVLVVRGRVTPLKWYSFFQWGWREPAAWFREWWNPTQPTAMVDLAKPAWRIGLADIDVNTAGLRLAVDVQPEKKDYKPGETATVKLKVSAPDGKPLPADSEIAFAAVDQALLELQPNESWQLLDAMLPRRAYEVRTATAQSQVIGKRHYGRKAVPPGGGGGRAPARELFDTLLIWQPRVKVGAGGTATVQVPINDSLTEFKFVGVASGGASLFGTGSASIRTRQDLQLISGLPPLVREKDRYQALLTVRNSTAKPISVRVTARAGERALDTREVALEPESARELVWTAQAPEGVSSLPWEFEAANVSGADGAQRDRLKIVQRVEPSVPLTVQQASFARVEGRLTLPVAPPAGALPGKGGVEIALSSKLAAVPPGVTRYFERYPFSCLEQQTSTAVGLHDAKRWQQVVDSLPALLDGDGLARYFPMEMPGSVTLTAYLLDMANLTGTALPDDAKRRMENGLAAFVEGRVTRKPWAPAQTDAQLAAKLTALEALTRSGVRSAALVRAAAALELVPLRLPTAALIDAWLVARRLADLPERSAKLLALEREVRNRLSYTGGRLGFTSEQSDYWWWMMVSGDSNAFRLIEAVLDEPGWRDDLPKLLRGALERQARGHWFTTTANAWAVIALDGYAKRFERDEVTGSTRAKLAQATVEYRWPGQAGAAPLSLPWPTAPADLVVEHQGKGQPWASLQTLAAIPAGAPRNFGYRVTRTVTPVEEKEKGKASRGDLWRVRLDVEAEQDMTWVVIDDPIPAGARILGEGDGRDSRIATLDEDRIGRRLWPTFVERTASDFRAYYEVAPRGRFSIEYTLRLNNAGEFALPPTRVEAMYAPDVFGETPNAPLTVAP